MYSAFLIFDIFASFLLLLSWGSAWLLAELAARRPVSTRRRVWAWVGVAALGFTELLVVLRLLLALGLWSFGWPFAESRVLIALPQLMVSALATLIWSLPPLWRIARGLADQAATPDPWPGIPLVAGTCSAVIGVYVVAAAPKPVTTVTVAVPTALFVAVVAVAAALARRRRAGSAPRPAGIRAWRALALVLALGVGLGGWFMQAANASRLPDHMSMLGHEVDYGGGPAHAHGMGGVSVAELTGPREGEPDERFTLTARAARVRLSSGKSVDAWTFNGQTPGPELRVRQGDLVEVTLINANITEGVTIHWHGVDVPNAEDGVAGMTQNAVPPGGRHVYRFRAEDAGTYWYHSHQVSSEQVRKGLFGTFVVLPRESSGPFAAATLDQVVVAHAWRADGVQKSVRAFGVADTLQRQAVAAGTHVRLRLVNTSVKPWTFTLTGAPFRVAAIDGSELHEPTDLRGASLKLAAGGRYDLTFAMPDDSVLLAGTDDEPTPGLLLSPDGSGEPPAIERGDDFDPANYGSPAPTPFGLASDFDRAFTLTLDNQFGFYNGHFSFLWTINGEVFPNVPTLMVREGDLVKMTFVNRSMADHPMHLHGHHVLVLSRNGEPVTGSPWWADTLDVAPGEVYEVAFRADNPGVWMDHCHNLDHAAMGMTMHLAYEGVTTPFEIGPATGNQPE